MREEVTFKLFRVLPPDTKELIARVTTTTEYAHDETGQPLELTVTNSKAEVQGIEINGVRGLLDFIKRIKLPDTRIQGQTGYRLEASIRKGSDTREENLSTFYTQQGRSCTLQIAENLLKELARKTIPNNPRGELAVTPWYRNFTSKQLALAAIVAGVSIASVVLPKMRPEGN